MFGYFKDIGLGIWHLMQGMYISLLNMVRPKFTEAYPENRLTKVKMERFRGELTMPHNEHNEHRCTACGICMNNCPNGTITVTSRKDTGPDGKERRALDRYLYDIGSCTFCSLCTLSCPQGAISWTPEFEHTVFTRSKLVKQLNHEGSTLAAKDTGQMSFAPTSNSTNNGQMSFAPTSNFKLQTPNS